MIKVIFCVLDEAQNLKTLLPNLVHEMEVLETSYEIIVCLDGSTDGSFEILSNFQKFHPIKILPQKNKRGLGIAYKRLFDETLKNSQDDDIIISLDADNTHNPDQIPEMVQHFKDNKLDLLIASRFCNTSIMEDFPWHRKMISKTTSIVLQKLFTVKKVDQKNLLDYTSGYRIYNSKIIHELFLAKGVSYIVEPEFTYTCELAINISRQDARIDEIPISYDYGKKIGESKLRIFKNLVRLIILVTKLKVT